MEWNFLTFLHNGFVKDDTDGRFGVCLGSGLRFRDMANQLRSFSKDHMAIFFDVLRGFCNNALSRMAFARVKCGLQFGVDRRSGREACRCVSGICRRGGRAGR